ncbi:ADP-heptose--lipopolysaccharide heptosyltransferase [Geotalea daltonii FRC-32]|uniref:ADP-heptose--lipopolysaccharide heptosyltransferase n=1 Tax=Geotalea daltonii (strain DSM 22248 / JCM 15807 / FRC-32) TaxID=316067 RepID=B9M0J6_GEODF|nr:glycosyltransferase family 9 protein [Geotalea daltonii]ACM19033.1 ADP-heptose--lipopolysaccharide heptosyltransferase [Geotalea daltonii FRC-32]
MCTKILVIKLGYSETLDPEIGKVPSLGDVLRTTPILSALKERYPDSQITWLVSEHAEPLLYRNPYIDRLLIWDNFVPFQLMKEKFDVLINLEKIPGVCALTDMIDAWVKYGFRFETISGSYHAYEKGLDFISYIEGKHSGNDKRFWQQVLIEMLGVQWKGQEYVIGYVPNTEETFDVGLNFEVGAKWPVKGMPMAKWQQLEKLLVRHGYTVSWQEGRKNLFEYMNWINSCRLIISNDSLGMHLAFGFHKKVIGLFGPTDPSEVYFYTGGKLLRSSCRCSAMPCFDVRCRSGKECMAHFQTRNIAAAAAEILGAPLAHENTCYRIAN